MTNRLLGIVVVLLGLALLTRLFVSGAMLFVLIAAVLGIAAATGALGRAGYVLAGIFLLLGFAGFAVRSVFIAIGLLFKLAPVILVLVGIYMIAKAIRS